MAEVPDLLLGLPATPGVVGVLEGRQCAHNSAFGCVYHPLKSLAVRSGGVAIPGCDAARSMIKGNSIWGKGVQRR